MDVDADRQAQADASVVRSLPVGSHGSGALAVACWVAGPSSSCDAGLAPVCETLSPIRPRAEPRACPARADQRQDDEAPSPQTLRDTATPH